MIDAGKPSEPRVTTFVVARLTAQGNAVRELPAKDDRGEDGVLEIDGTCVTLQIVNPAPQELWRDVREDGEATVGGRLDDAAAWIENAIAKKTRRYAPDQKKGMLLAIDVAHAGVLIDPTFRAIYLSTYGDPSDEFDAVWLVGPTANDVIGVGNGRWQP